MFRFFPIACTVLAYLISNCAITLAQDLPQDSRDSLASWYVQMATADHVVNSAARVDAQGGTLVWTRASGFADPGRQVAMTAEHQFRTASVSKSLTGCVVMQLIEEGKFEFDTPLKTVLSAKRIPWDRKLSAIHVHDGEELGDSITIRHLLNHTSGLSDYWFDQGTQGSFAGKSWLDVFEQEAFGREPEIFDPPTRLWHPNEILQFHYETGLNEQAHFAPGESYFYSDTNYLLLGMLIEDVTQKSYSQNIRERILEPLQMENTYTEYREEPVSPRLLAHHFWYLGGQNLDIVEERLASTAEWANGGHVTTLEDLSKFIRGLFDGKLFKNANSLERMLGCATLQLTEPQKYFDHGESTLNLYSCGLKRWQIEGHEVWGHTGFWGIGMFYLPECDVAIVFAKNQVESTAEGELKKLIQSLAPSALLQPR